MAKAETGFTPETDFTGDALIDLVVAIEAAIGRRGAGCTPLGIAVITLCEEAADAARLRTETLAALSRVEQPQ